MKLSENTLFERIDFENLEIPEFIVETESNYDIDLQKSNYVLEQNQYDEYTARWARVYDWYCVQYARALYNKKKMETEMSKIYMMESSKIPDGVKTKAAREAWIEQNSTEYHRVNALYAEASGYFSYFEGKRDSTKIKHYNCKSMSSSIDSDNPIGAF
jgi:hypothetical protein